MTGSEPTFSEGDRVVGIGGRVGIIDRRQQGGWRVKWEDGTATVCGEHMLTLAPPDRVTQAIITEARENAAKREAASDAEPLDPCRQIAESVGYHGEGEASMEALIAYKEGLEDALGRAVDENRTADSEAARAAEVIATGVPKEDDWDSAADFMEHAAETLDIYGVERPEHYPEAV